MLNYLRSNRSYFPSKGNAKGLFSIDTNGFVKVAKCIGAQEIGTDHDLIIATNYGDQSVGSPLKVSIKSVEDKSFSNSCPVTGCTTDYGDPANYR